MYGSGKFCSMQCSRGWNKISRIEPYNNPEYKKCKHKECRQKDQEQPIDNFYRIKSDNDKRRDICKECQKVDIHKSKSILKNYIKDMYDHMITRAYNYNRICSITYEELINMWIEQNGKCKMSGRQMTHVIGDDKETEKNPFNASIDRISSDNGYVSGNVQLICNWLNVGKSDYKIDDFIKWIKISGKHIKSQILQP
jgi:hypothetical protein